MLMQKMPLYPHFESHSANQKSEHREKIVAAAKDRENGKTHQVQGGRRPDLQFQPSILSRHV